MTAPTSNPPFDPPLIARCSGEVYLFAMSHSAAHIRRSVNEPLLQQRQPKRIEIWRDGDIESAIAIQKRRIRPIELQAPLVHQEHRHARPILAGVKHFLGFVIVGMESWNFWRAVNAGLLCRQI